MSNKMEHFICIDGCGLDISRLLEDKSSLGLQINGYDLLVLLANYLENLQFKKGSRDRK